MRTLRGLVIGVALLCVFWTIPVHATVDWNEGFEYANDAAMHAVWSASQTTCTYGGPTPSSDRAFTGSKSAKLTFRGVAGSDPGAGGCFIDRNLSGISETLWTRFYIYMENFAVNNVQTKMTFQGQAGAYPSFWWSMNYGFPNIGIQVQGIILDNGTQSTENIFGGAIPQNQWACVELRLTMSTPGVDNGIVQAWVNGAQSINKTNQRMRPAIAYPGVFAFPTAHFNFVRLYTQHGVGAIYYDDYAVSRDARIGCTGSPSGNSVAPGQVRDFKFLGN